ncbi:hypothetical protein Tco_0641034 [Tanacetum coccineum]
MEAPQGSPVTSSVGAAEELSPNLNVLVGMIASAVVYECGDVILNLLRGDNTEDGADGGIDDSDDVSDDDAVSLIFI